jgi:hypothetical protein
VSNLDRLKASLQLLLRPFTRRLDYSCLYGATVVSQNSDGSLELTASSPRLPPLSRVPLRYGIPGVAATVNPGALALVGFENADPALVYAMLASSAMGVATLALLGGNQPIAREGDVISVPFPPALAFNGTIGGLPAVGVLTVPPQPMPGVIVTGRKDVLA